MADFPTDWNEYLGLTPTTQTRSRELEPYNPDPLGGWQIPSGLSTRQVNDILSLGLNLKRQQDEQRSAAIRYQGQMEYEDMISSGMAPDEAMRRAAPKMFYENEGGMTQATRLMQPPESLGSPMTEDVTDDAGNPIGTVLTFPGGKRQVIPARRQAPPDITKDIGFVDLTQQINLISRELQDKKKEIAKQSGLGEQFADVALLRQARLLQEELDRKRLERKALVAAGVAPQMPAGPQRQAAPQSQETGQDIPQVKGRLTDQATAREFLRQAGGDKAKARELARAAGWEL